jgi:prophage regulatory protein
MRLPQVLAATGETKTAMYAKMATGLMPRVIKIGARAVALPAHEVNAMNAARIRGASEKELRALVADLHARRAQAA